MLWYGWVISITEWMVWSGPWFKPCKRTCSKCSLIMINFSSRERSVGWHRPHTKRGEYSLHRLINWTKALTAIMSQRECLDGQIESSMLHEITVSSKSPTIATITWKFLTIAQYSVSLFWNINSLRALLPSIACPCKMFYHQIACQVSHKKMMLMGEESLKGVCRRASRL